MYKEAEAAKILALIDHYENKWHEAVIEGKIHSRERDKPYPDKVFDDMQETLGTISKVAWQGKCPEGSYDYENYERPDKKSRNDIDMVALGFNAVAYEHLDASYQLSLKRFFLYNFAEAIDQKIDAPIKPMFNENRRVYRDHFELTYGQAKILQRITKKVNLSYDPGGKEPTSENIAKRTFRARDYLDRPFQ